MTTMTTPTPRQILTERLDEAREAAYCLNLPRYLLTRPMERKRLGVPHYRVGKLLRFKLSELSQWIEQLQPVHPVNDLQGGGDA